MLRRIDARLAGLGPEALAGIKELPTMKKALVSIARGQNEMLPIVAQGRPARALDRALRPEIAGLPAPGLEMAGQLETDDWACPHYNKQMRLLTIMIREPATTQLVRGVVALDRAAGGSESS